MERTTFNPSQVERRRIAVWTPWGTVPTLKARSKRGRELTCDKQIIRHEGERLRGKPRSG